MVEGNRRTSLRQDVLAELDRRGHALPLHALPRGARRTVNPPTCELDDLVYHPADAEEHFLSFVTPDDRLAGYLRLSLPPAGTGQSPCRWRCSATWMARP